MRIDHFVVPSTIIRLKIILNAYIRGAVSRFFCVPSGTARFQRFRQDQAIRSMEIAMTTMSRTSATRLAIGAAFALVNIVGLAGSANAVSLRVQMACASDYFSYCSKYPTEGSQVRQCMRANGHKLSSACVSALVAAGEVSKAEVARRAARAN